MTRAVRTWSMLRWWRNCCPLRILSLVLPWVGWRNMDQHWLMKGERGLRVMLQEELTGIGSWLRGKRWKDCGAHVSLIMKVRLQFCNPIRMCKEYYSIFSFIRNNNIYSIDKFWLINLISFCNLFFCFDF